VETVVGPAKKIRHTWDEIWTFKSWRCCKLFGLNSLRLIYKGTPKEKGNNNPDEACIEFSGTGVELPGSPLLQQTPLPSQSLLRTILLRPGLE
jgi:hypothetical protein